MNGMAVSNDRYIPKFWRDPMLISIVAILVYILIINCGTVNHSRKLGKVPQKLDKYIPETVGASLLPARFLAWNTCHTST